MDPRTQPCSVPCTLQVHMGAANPRTYHVQGTGVVLCAIRTPNLSSIISPTYLPPSHKPVPCQWVLVPSHTGSLKIQCGLIDPQGSGRVKLFGRHHDLKANYQCFPGASPRVGAWDILNTMQNTPQQNEVQSPSRQRSRTIPMTMRATLQEPRANL